MGFDPFMPKITIGKGSFGFKGSGVDTYIGITFRVAGADIKVFL